MVELLIKLFLNVMIEYCVLSMFEEYILFQLKLRMLLRFSHPFFKKKGMEMEAAGKGSQGPRIKEMRKKLVY